MSSSKPDILSLDNLWHSLFAATIVSIWCAVLLLVREGAYWFDGYAFIGAALAAAGLYVREAAQVDWDWSLRWSAHKWAEALTGGIVGGVVAIGFAVAT